MNYMRRRPSSPGKFSIYCLIDEEEVVRVLQGDIARFLIARLGFEVPIKTLKLDTINCA